jgi:hypothetical protein
MEAKQITWREVKGIGEGHQHRFRLTVSRVASRRVWTSGPCLDCGEQVKGAPTITEYEGEHPDVADREAARDGTHG